MVAKKPVTKKPVAKKPVAKKPVTKKPVAKKPVAKKPVAKKPVAKKAAVERGMSDAAVQAKTGRTWDEWFRILDAHGAAKLDHKGIVAILADRYGVGPWWQQTVTVAYEQARGLREKHETAVGFQIGASRTIAAPADELFARWESARERRRFIDGDQLRITTATAPKSIRGAWGDTRGRVDIAFSPSAKGRTQVAVQHRRLASAAEADRFKAFWLEALERLETLAMA